VTYSYARCFSAVPHLVCCRAEFPYWSSRLTETCSGLNQHVNIKLPVWCLFAVFLSQNLKLSKQLESAAADRHSGVSRLETRLEELAAELAAVNEAKSRLETQCEESRQRVELDADEQLSQLQNELQASTHCCHGCCSRSRHKSQQCCDLCLLLLQHPFNGLFSRITSVSRY